MIYKCRSCGGNVVYNPDQGVMVCPNCQSQETQEAVRDSEMLKCSMCGADLTVGEHVSSTKCEHCGTYSILEERVTGVFEPHLVLPFQIGKEKAAEILKEEFKNRLFTPKSFLKSKTLEDLQGSYVPFWLYDYFGKYIYDGIGTKVRSWRSGDTEYTETSKFQIHRDIEMNYEKIPVDASIAMDDSTMDFMEPYEYNALLDFDEKYLSGFFGEKYNDDAEVFEPRAQKKAKEYSQECLNGTMQGYTTITPTSQNLQLERKETNYALFPVWVYTYRFNKKNYKFYVNGQTGKVVGKTPVSRERVAAVSVSLFATVFLFAKLLISILEVL